MDHSFSAASDVLTAETHAPWLERQAKGFGIHDISTLRGQDLIALAHKIYGDRLSVLASFGTESAVMLSMVAAVEKKFDVAIRVLFIDTQKLFAETIAYKNELIAFLGLRNVQTIVPDPLEVAAEDPLPLSRLWLDNRKACCALRKTRPLDAALEQIGKTPHTIMERLENPLNQIAQELGGKVAVMNGMRRGHNRGRDQISNNVVVDEHRWDGSPLYDYSDAEVHAIFEEQVLPKHPLENQYASIGCTPVHCTSEQGRFIKEAPADQNCGVTFVNGKVFRVKNESLDSLEGVPPPTPTPT